MDQTVTAKWVQFDLMEQVETTLYSWQIIFPEEEGSIFQQASAAYINCLRIHIKKWYCFLHFVPHISKCLLHMAGGWDEFNSELN